MKQIERMGEVHDLQRSISAPADGLYPSGIFKKFPSDFEVIEQLGFSPEENPNGQQHWLRIAKTGVTTEDLAKQLSKLLRIHPRDIGYSGLKDKHAVTEQWFTVQLPARLQLDWFSWWNEHVTAERLRGGHAELRESIKSNKKLRRGTHKANHFRLTLRNVTDKQGLENRLQALSLRGSVPNYFGPQRFGKYGDNVAQALAMARGEKHVGDRQLKSILLSSVRSWLFNSYLHRRLAQNLPDLMEGDVVLLAGTHSYFTIECIDEIILERFRSGDILVSGPMYGETDSPARGEVRAFEDKLAAEYPEFLKVLCDARMKFERRALYLPLSSLRWEWLEDTIIKLEFSLPAGSFATSVLAELGSFQEESYACLTE